MAQAKQYTSANWKEEAMRRPTPSPFVQRALAKIGIEYDSENDIYIYPEEPPKAAKRKPRGKAAVPKPSKVGKQSRGRKTAG